MLVTCPTCGAKISVEADPCPKCGFPNAGRESEERKKKNRKELKKEKEFANKYGEQRTQYMRLLEEKIQKKENYFCIDSKYYKMIKVKDVTRFLTDYDIEVECDPYRIECLHLPLNTCYNFSSRGQIDDFLKKLTSKPSKIVRGEIIKKGIFILLGIIIALLIFKWFRIC